MATDAQIAVGVADGRRCPSCRAYWTWCRCTNEMIDAARERWQDFYGAAPLRRAADAAQTEQHDDSKGQR